MEALKVGNVLNRNILEPLSWVMRSRHRIIERMRASVVVIIGTKKLGKPKCNLNWRSPSEEGARVEIGLDRGRVERHALAGNLP